MTDLTPELNALMSVVRFLPPDLVRQIADFAEFLGEKHAKAEASKTGSAVDDDTVDLGGSVFKNDWSDLSTVFLIKASTHSAIGLI
jgi:hypothetical protein